MTYLQIDPRWEVCVDRQMANSLVPSPLECQFLPTALSGRDCQVTMRPVHEDGKLLSDGLVNFDPHADLFFQAGYQPTVFCLYLTLIAMQAKLAQKVTLHKHTDRHTTTQTDTQTHRPTHKHTDEGISSRAA